MNDANVAISVPIQQTVSRTLSGQALATDCGVVIPPDGVPVTLHGEVVGAMTRDDDGRMLAVVSKGAVDWIEAHNFSGVSISGRKASHK